MVDIATQTMEEENKKKYDGKIYKITSGKTDRIYIGSTCSTLNRRFGVHLKAFQSKKYYISSYEIIKEGDAKIELIETLNCESPDELRRKEGEHIKLNKDKIVNIRIAGRTRSEHYNDNREYLIQKMREFRMKNIDVIRMKDRQRKKDIRDKIKLLKNGE